METFEVVQQSTADVTLAHSWLATDDEPGSKHAQGFEVCSAISTISEIGRA